jgi:hypothetical protein
MLVYVRQEQCVHSDVETGFAYVGTRILITFMLLQFLTPYSLTTGGLSYEGSQNTIHRELTELLI